LPVANGSTTRLDPSIASACPGSSVVQSTPQKRCSMRTIVSRRACSTAAAP
jgi:hypothetical protein